MEKIAEQVPALAVLSFVVITFLKHLAARDLMFKKIADDNAKIVEKANTVLKENTEVLAGVKEVLYSVKKQLGDCRQ